MLDKLLIYMTVPHVLLETFQLLMDRCVTLLRQTALLSLLTLLNVLSVNQAMLSMILVFASAVQAEK